MQIQNDFSTKSQSLLQLRGLSEQQVSDFSALLTKAQAQQQEQHLSYKQVVQGLSADELKLLQQGNSLANPINTSMLSEEGAQNLFAQPDGSDLVDLNNDGIVEHGEAKTITFPPANAPEWVKKAWDEATADMSESDKMMMQFHMHHMVYGFQIDGVATKTAPLPEQQWSTSGWQDLIARCRSALDFAVNMDGWTDFNKVSKAFYDNFEQALSTHTA
ncbi:hypothetical protein [Neptunicella marina]|uniref:Uncharacterized protein n=1 Tax=Neptunicella marina TaxID=2125989 RepID=A0A8J6M025_9ALTE|nr:hypothetical protein [Neptunicella marina]MBC3764602.1 hypothetical protein [Neptunicella marina]